MFKYDKKSKRKCFKFPTTTEDLNHVRGKEGKYEANIYMLE